MEEKEKSEGMSKSKKKKIMIVVAAVVIVVVMVAVVLISMQPVDPYTEVNDILKDTTKYSDEEVEVAGTVGEIQEPDNDTLEIRFELIDRDNSDKRIWVSALTQPEGFVPGKDVVVTGTLKQDIDGDYYIQATDIQVGCPSKYE